jgi:hypothetical protein
METALIEKLLTEDFCPPHHIRNTLSLVARRHGLLKVKASPEGNLVLINIDPAAGRREDPRPW